MSSRYSRNINVEGFSAQMQERLFTSSVLVVGAGGLGSAVISYLAVAGVGRIGIFEYDEVSESNLQRQILYYENDLGKSKGLVALENIRRRNSSCEAELYQCCFEEQNGIEIAASYDIIVDCTDNYEARKAIDKVSKQLGIPFVYGSTEQLQGQVSTFNYGGAGSYCDLYPETPESKRREILGVLSPMPGIIGTIQALEVIKILTGMSGNLCGKLLLIDATNYSTVIFDI